jgi:hypothetical protein
MAGNRFLETIPPIILYARSIINIKRLSGAVSLDRPEPWAGRLPYAYACNYCQHTTPGRTLAPSYETSALWTIISIVTGVAAPPYWG